MPRIDTGNRITLLLAAVPLGSASVQHFTSTLYDALGKRIMQRMTSGTIIRPTDEEQAETLQAFVASATDRCTHPDPVPSDLQLEHEHQCRRAEKFAEQIEAGCTVVATFLHGAPEVLRQWITTRTARTLSTTAPVLYVSRKEWLGAEVALLGLTDHYRYCRLHLAVPHLCIGVTAALYDDTGRATELPERAQQRFGRILKRRIARAEYKIAYELDVLESICEALRMTFVDRWEHPLPSRIEAQDQRPMCSVTPLRTRRSERAAAAEAGRA